MGFEQGGDDDNSARAGGEDLGESFGGDAADAEGWDFGADIAFHGGDVLKADGGSPSFGGGGKKWAEADAVEAFSEGGACLVEGMGGAADDHVRADDFAGIGE